ncbi:cell elongation, e phase; peptidoglycan synthetase; penicillin-binding protein 2 [Klebsiella pneumoniae]|nr:cell elongation, e phase; peptidoglycan synthetase; penicillin-binding protein 2 [Klebsiella pneumoniae]
MPLLRDEIRDHSAEEMLFIRRAAIAFLLVVVCFGVLIVNLYHLQVEQHDFYQTRSNQNDIKMLPIAPSRGLIFDRNGIPLVQNITLYRLQVIPSKIPDMAALLQQLTPIVDLTPDDIASFRDDMHHTSRYKAVTLKSDSAMWRWPASRSTNSVSPA